MTITGPFSVNLKPLDAYANQSEGADLGRMSIDKTFFGPLEGTSQGEMLTAMSPVKGSAGYVAIEKVTGSLEGRSGCFVLQHFGIISAAGESRLVLEVVPDSGTGELIGLTGSMDIDRGESGHTYSFKYEL